MLRLLIGSRYALLRSGFRSLLEQPSHFEVIEECASVADVVAGCIRSKPDALVVDSELEDGQGIEAIRRLAECRHEFHALLLGEWNDPWAAVRAMEAGALGFAWRYIDTAELSHAVRDVAAGRPFLPRELSQQMALLRINVASDPFSKLSRREFEIFRLIATGKNLTHVAQTLSLSPRSVANYQSLIKSKLEVSSTAELVHLAIRHGVIHVQA